MNIKLWQVDNKTKRHFQALTMVFVNRLFCVVGLWHLLNQGKFSIQPRDHFIEWLAVRDRGKLCCRIVDHVAPDHLVSVTAALDLIDQNIPSPPSGPGPSVNREHKRTNVFANVDGHCQIWFKIDHMSATGWLRACTMLSHRRTDCRHEVLVGVHRPQCDPVGHTTLFVLTPIRRINHVTFNFILDKVKSGCSEQWWSKNEYKVSAWFGGGRLT